MKKKFNNIGYKLACLFIGLFVLATVIMAWIGGLSTIPKKSVTASADTVKSVVGRVALAPFVGTFVDNTPIISKSTVYFNYDFTAHDYYFTVYDNNVLSSTLSSSNITSGLTYLTFTTFGGYSSSMSFTCELASSSVPEFTVISHVYFQYGENSFILVVEGYDGSTSTIGINQVRTVYFEFTAMMPFTIPTSYIGTTYGFIVCNLSNTNNSSIDTQTIFDNGYRVGYDEGNRVGKLQGETVGYNKALSELSEGTTFSELLNAIFFAPTTFLYNLLNFEILGVNIYGIFTAILTIGVMSFIVRLFL